MVKNAHITAEKTVKPADKKSSAPSSQHPTRQLDISSLQHLQRAVMSGNLRPADILQLQRSLGNRAVGALLRGIEPMRTVVQAKSADNKPTNQYEQESENHQSKPASLKPNNTGLPDNLKSGIEALSGFSMDNVRVHYNSSKPAQLNALAYTQGTDIHVAPGMEKHLPHEAWHVVQQIEGRVKPTRQLMGTEINDAQDLEQEADVMGEKANYAAANARIPTTGLFNYSLPAVIQGMRIGKIPTFAWFQSNVKAHAGYDVLAQSSTYNHDCQDFSEAMKDKIYDKNQSYFAHIPKTPNPITDPTKYASDRSGKELRRLGDSPGQMAEIDHIIEFNDYGCNDFRNARILSRSENNPGPVPRPAANEIEVLCMENITIAGVSYENKQILSKDDLISLLEAADKTDYKPTHGPINELPDIMAMDETDFDAIYKGLKQTNRAPRANKIKSKRNREDDEYK